MQCRGLIFTRGAESFLCVVTLFSPSFWQVCPLSPLASTAAPVKKNGALLYALAGLQARGVTDGGPEASRATLWKKRNRSEHWKPPRQRTIRAQPQCAGLRAESTERGQEHTNTAEECRCQRA